MIKQLNGKMKSYVKKHVEAVHIAKHQATHFTIHSLENKIVYFWGCSCLKIAVLTYLLSTFLPVLHHLVVPMLSYDSFVSHTGSYRYAFLF